MLFSIIVPVYKVEKYLNQCIDSILSQTFSDFEVILVDDGSPDNCGKICDEYSKKDPRIKVIHQSNEGVCCARKTGIFNSIGDYIVCVDSDDYIGSDLLDKIAEVVNNYKPDVIAYNYTSFGSKGCRVVSNGYKSGMYVDEELSIIKANIIYDKSLPSLNYSRIIYAIWSKAVKREFMLKHCERVPNEITIGEDMALTSLLIINSRSVYFLDCNSYYYRINPLSVTNSFNFAKITVLKMLVKFLHCELGEEYLNNIAVYTLVMLNNYIANIAEISSGYDEFLKLVKENITDELQSYIRVAKVYRSTIKVKIFEFALKNKMYFIFWIRYKKRKK